MHPILFRIPLPAGVPLKLWWGLAAIAVLAAIYALVSLKKADRGTAAIAGAVLVAAGVAARVYRTVEFNQPNVPIYSYGVMLGLSLVVGWYLTLTLAEKDGLPKETMANCYVVTALAAIVGSRVLYIATNLDEFKTFSDLFALRRGGLVAYGGFLGGYLGSWFFLSQNRIKLMPWADVAVPSLASGLFITRIGCYLFGCDFGTTLPKTAPGWLQKLGTFPHWPESMMDSGQGSPAYVRHLATHHDEALALNSSLPVHPTQIYESLAGLFLVALLLLQRKNQKFRGQVFFLFAFAYGVIRFLLEIIRDDEERGTYGPVMAEHLLVPGALLLLAVGFAYGISLGIQNEKARMAARVVAFLVPVVTFFMLKPASFAGTTTAQLSTSQWIALATALAVSYFYAKFWEEARKSPKLAMSLGLPGGAGGSTSEEADREEDEEDAQRKVTLAEAPDAKRARKSAAPKSETAPESGRGRESDAPAPEKG